ncbi:DUF2334 domain-containing protein [Methylocystis parvus]|uniref:DUF2334 domain-containing protein n=1 Tax=Methylocystis parvus TaxID=134 RepID=UPI003C77482E
MSSQFKIRRRQLLLGVAAGLAQSSLPSDLLAQSLQPVPSRRSKRRGAPDDMIPKDPSNPFFKPQGGAQTKPVHQVPRLINGDGLEKDDKKLKGKGALLEPDDEIEFAGATDADEGLIQTAAFTIPALSLDEETTKIASSRFAPVLPQRPLTLVLFDTTGQWGWLGELYGIMVANLASHFGGYTLMPVSQYTAGMMANYKAVVYVGSTYDETSLANGTTPFLADVPTYQNVNVVWIHDNIWRLPSINSTYKIAWAGFETPPSSVGAVTYKNVSFKRYNQNPDGIMTYATLDPSVTVLANCVRADNTTFPWAVRSLNLTYIGENPLVYLTEGDRYLIFCDLLFDALGATEAPGGKKAILRLEDNDFQSDPVKLRQVADWLQSQGVPFGYHIIPRYRDPFGFYNNGQPQDIRFNNPAMAGFRDAIVYFQGKGGVPILHGWTHQYYNINYVSEALNPETGVSADDCEFFRLIWNAGASTFTYAGPLPQDIQDHQNNVNTWVSGRMTSALNDIALDPRITLPTLFTTPHYLGTTTTLNAASQKFAARAERALYYPGILAAKSGGSFDYRLIDYSKMAGQYFPYKVKDIYGGKVLPDTLGSIEPVAYLGYAARLPQDIIDDAARLLAVRDGVAAFQYHSDLDISYLQAVVTGLKNLGYTFVAPTSLV